MALPIPTIFQEKIDRTLGRQTPVWLDDIIVVTRGTKEEHTRKLYSARTKLENEGYRAHYNGNKGNIVATDSCKTVSGVALWQKQGSGDLKPIAFASRYSNDAEKKYSIGELELLAVVWGLERFTF